MLSLEQLEEKIQVLSTRHKAVLRRKLELGGELKAKKEELAALVDEIKKAGYNPKTLIEDRDKAQEELELLLKDFEANLVGAEKTLEDFEKSK
jgi:uncharacterized protein YoxC